MADPPRPPRPRSRTLDEAIERRRRQEEADKEAARRDARYESTDPPPRDPWPPRVKAGQGSPSTAPPPKPHAEAAHRAMLSVWGIIAILVGAAGGGWGARAFFGDVPTKQQVKDLSDELKEIKRTCGASQEQNQVTFAGVKTDIDWIKKELQAKQAEPLKTGGRR